MANGTFSIYPLDDDLAMARLVSAGLPVTAIRKLGAALGVRPVKVGPLVNINEKTLERRLQSGDRLKPAESERVARLMRIMALATVVLENETHAREWLKRPLKVLAGKSPLELTSTEPGAREVEHVLGRLEHGVFS
jgi:putative toxin-antitoxin system antitoxin component (TIGR02293 family)